MPSRAACARTGATRSLFALSVVMGCSGGPTHSSSGGAPSASPASSSSSTATALAATEEPCDYGGTEPCRDGRVCALVDTSHRAICVSVVETSEPMAAPFVRGTRYAIGQAGRSALGRSHSFRSDLYAVDFVPSMEVPTQPVVAPVSGKLALFDGCEEREEGPTAAYDSGCGLGYGNHVRIWDGEKIVLLAHLARVTVRGDHVRVGEVLGPAGASGRAGYRHVHVGTTRPPSSAGVTEILAQPGWLGSVPVRSRYIMSSDVATVTLAADELVADESWSASWQVP